MKTISDEEHHHHDGRYALDEGHHHEHTGDEEHHHHGQAGDGEHVHDESVLIDDGKRLLTVTDHEGSLVASYRFTLPGSLTSAKQTLSDLTTGIADEVYAKGGIVGHIKAFAQSQGDSFRISITMHDPGIIDFSDASVRVEGVAIVLGVERDWYEHYLTELIESLQIC